MNICPVSSGTVACLASVLVGLLPLGLAADANYLRVEAYPGCSPDSQAFVVPLSFQSGAALDRNSDNSDRFGGEIPWISRIDAFNDVRGDYVPGYVPLQIYQRFRNPLAAYGGACGAPLHVGQPYQFGLHAGTYVNLGNGLEDRSEIRIRAYPRNAFQDATASNIAHVAEQIIVVPVPPAFSPDLGDPAWQSFVSNDFSAVHEMPGLRSTLTLVEGDVPEDKWGLMYSRGCVLSHVATSDAYLYIVEAKGQVIDLMFAEPMARDYAGAAAFRSLYAMEFEYRPQWRSTYIHQPHFNAEPLPADYQGRSPEELLRAGASVPDFASPPDPGACMALDASPDLRRHPMLDRFVASQRSNDPVRDALTFANYALNEIELTDPLSYHDSGSYETNSVNAGGVNRNALGVFMEGQGNPSEICSFLVYCLRSCGIPAAYAFPEPNSMRMLDSRLGRLLRMRLVGAVDHRGRPELAGSPTTNLLANAGREPALVAVNYPWVAAFVPDPQHGGTNRWTHIFPWLADTEIVEGLDLYAHVGPVDPSDEDGVRNAWQWLDRYVRGDSRLLGLSEQNTPASIFPAFVGKRLAVHHPGVAMDQIGVRVRNRKHHFTRLPDLPRPFSVSAPPNYHTTLEEIPNAFDSIRIEVLENANVLIDTGEMRSADLHNRRLLIRQEKTRTGSVVTEPPFNQYHYSQTNLFVSASQQEKIWTHTVKNPHSADVKVKIALDGANGFFSISERDDGGWSSDVEFSSLDGQGSKKLYIRFQSKAGVIGHQRAKVGVDFVNYSKDYDIYCGATVNDYPDARLSLTLAPFRESDAGTNSFGGLSNPLMSRQEINAALSAQDMPLYVRVTHRRHRAFDPSNPPPGCGDFLDVIAGLEILQKRPLARGDLAAICLNMGRVTPRMLEAQAQDYWRMERQLDADPALVPDPEIMQGTAAYLMGMTYYERVSRFDRQLADLHKVRTLSRFAIGLSRINAFRSDGQIPMGQFSLVEPNVDMFFDMAGRAANMNLHPDSSRPTSLDYENFLLLSIADVSAQEHRAINTFFKQKDAVSTVRLLQLAAQSTNGVERLERLNYIPRGDTVVAGKPLKDHNTSIWNSIKAAFADPTATGDDINSIRLADYARAYLTPGPIEAAHDEAGKAHYLGMGALILTRDRLSALISGNYKMLPQNGGYGSHIPLVWSKADTLALDASFGGDEISVSLLQMAGGSPPQQSVSFNDSPSLHALPSLLDLDYQAVVTSGIQDRFAASALAMLEVAASGVESRDYMTALKLSTDLGLPGSALSYNGNLFDRTMRELNHAVADPVNILSGEFYIDETDLALPGPMPIQIRRNYASHNLVANQFGYGWKPSEFPSLGITTNASLIYAAEMDGSVIAYRQQATDVNLFLPTPSDNPHWTNMRNGVQGGPGNVLNNRLIRDIAPGGTNFALLGADGSRREFSVRSYPIGTGTDLLRRCRPYLDRWLDHAGNELRFTYGEDPSATDYGQLVRIESSAGNAIGFEYDARGHIVEAYALDGRRVKYEYDEHGDLTTVIRPDGSPISYDYLHGSHAVAGRTEFFSEHLITREEKPDGRLLINAYDDQRRVTNQCATVGVDLTPVRNATFLYANDFSPTNRRPVSGVTTLFDAYGNPTIYRYASGLITNIVDPLGREIAREWFFPGDVSPGAYPRALKSERDKRGLLTSYRYDARGNPTNITVIGDITGDGAPDTAITSIAYDANDMPTTVVGPLGHQRMTAFGDARFPRAATRVESRAPGGTLISADEFEYTSVGASPGCFAHGLLARHVRAAGSSDEAITTWGYDASGHPTARTNHTGTADPDVVIQYRHNARGELAESGDAAGRASLYDYDAMGRPTWHERRDANGQPVWWTGTYYNANGEPEWIDGPRYYPEDFVWRKYDGAGRPKEEIRWRSRAKADGSGVESPSGDDLYATTFFSHDLFGNLTSIIDARGNLAEMDYDAAGQLISHRRFDGRVPNPDALLSQEAFAYEPGGLVGVHTNALGGVSITDYTADGKPRRLRRPDGCTLEWCYDLVGRPIHETHANRSRTEYDYDDANRAVTKTLRSPDNGVLRTDYTAFDRRGNTIAATDPEGHATTSTYDGLDRPKTIVGPPADNGSARQRTTLYYDAAGVTRIAENALGERTITTADAIGRPSRIEILNGAGEPVRLTRFEYGPDHHSVTTIEGSGIGAPAITNTVFTDSFGNTVLAAHPDGFENWTRDPGGLPLVSIDAMGRATTYTHDGLGRPSSKTTTESGIPKTHAFSRDPLGNLVAHHLPTGLMETNAYDRAGRLLYSEWIAPDGARSHRRDFAYHPDGHRGAGLVATIGDARGVTRAIEYDAFGRTASETFSGSRLEHAMVRSFAYDRRNLPTAITETSASSTSTIARLFDPYGHIASETITLDGETVAAVSQSWDAAGRRTRLEATAPEPFAWSFAHRADGLPAGVSAAGHAVDYAFSDAGLLLGRSGPMISEQIARDPRGRPIARSYDRAGTPFYEERDLIWNPDGSLSHLMADDGRAPISFGFEHDDRGRITQERQTGAPEFVNYHHGYDAGGLGIRMASRIFNQDAGSPLWRGDVTGADALGQCTSWALDHDPLPVYVDGNAPGAGKVGVMIRSVALGLALAVAPWDAGGHWQLPAPARLYPGSADIVATATHPLGQYSAAATNAVDVSVLAPALSREFDPLGAVSAQSWSGEAARAQSLRHDALGRLIAVEERDASGRGFDWSAAYDPLGRRIRTTTIPVNGPDPNAALSTTSLYDPEVEFLEIGVTSECGEHVQTSWKLYGPDIDGTYGGLQGTGGLEAIIENDDAIPCLHDFAGNLVGSVDPNGEPRWKHIAYSAFGPRPDALIPHLNPGLSLIDATDFRGHRREPTGLYYWGARDYDPATASFLSPDPLGLAPGPNPYAFCLNNPINIHDPDGRWGKAIDRATLGPEFRQWQQNNQSWLEDNYPNVALGLDLLEMGAETPGAGIPIGSIRGLPLIVGASTERTVAAETRPLLYGPDGRVIATTEVPRPSHAALLYGPRGEVLMAKAELEIERFSSQLFSRLSQANAAKTGTQVGYHATRAEFADAILANRFRESQAGRLGGGGVYVNNSVEGAIAEYFAHNPGGPAPTVLRVEYTPGLNYQIAPPPGNYTTGPLPLAADTLTTESVRLPGTFNTLIRNGTATPMRP